MFERRLIVSLGRSIDRSIDWWENMEISHIDIIITLILTKVFLSLLHSCGRSGQSLIVKEGNPLSSHPTDFHPWTNNNIQKKETLQPMELISIESTFSRHTLHSCIRHTINSINHRSIPVIDVKKTRDKECENDTVGGEEKPSCVTSYTDRYLIINMIHALRGIWTKTNTNLNDICKEKKRKEKKRQGHTRIISLVTLESFLFIDVRFSINFSSIHRDNICPSSLIIS